MTLLHSFQHLLSRSNRSANGSPAIATNKPNRATQAMGAGNFPVKVTRLATESRPVAAGSPLNGPQIRVSGVSRTARTPLQGAPLGQVRTSVAGKSTNGEGASLLDPLGNLASEKNRRLASDTPILNTDRTEVDAIARHSTLPATPLAGSASTYQLVTTTLPVSRLAASFAVRK